MAHIYKRGKTWTVRVSKREKVWDSTKNEYISKLKQKQKGGFKTKAEANAYGIKMESATIDGVDVTKNPVFIDYMISWFELYKKPNVSLGTQKRYHLHFQILRKYFGQTKIKSIDRMKYQEFINKIAEHYAPNTISHLNGNIRSCVKYAVMDGLIPYDFTLDAKVHGNPDKEFKVTYLNVEEVQRLTKVVFKLAKPFAPSRYMILTALYTGMRLGEIGGLTWKDLDFEDNIIDINKSWNSDKNDFGPTKNKPSVRKVKVNSVLMSKLKELRQNHSNKNLVFDTGKGRPPLSREVNEVLRTMLKKAGINKPSLHFHSLRHVHVAFLLNNHIDISVISKRLGHKDMSTTLKYYAYLIDELKDKEEKKIISDLDNLTK